jgi:hypothetical protein
MEFVRQLTERYGPELAKERGKPGEAKPGEPKRRKSPDGKAPDGGPAVPKQ